MHAFFVKLLKTFLTSLMIHISRKLILHFENALAEYTSRDVSHVTCKACNYSYRQDIVFKMHNSLSCPNCYSKLITQDDVNEYSKQHPRYYKY